MCKQYDNKGIFTSKVTLDEGGEQVKSQDVANKSVPFLLGFKERIFKAQPKKKKNRLLLSLSKSKLDREIKKKIENDTSSDDP